MSTSRAAVVFAGRYRLDEWIAAGGMGEVWRATDLVLHRPVAVKVLRAEYAEHPETLARFRAEARHAGALSHPSIAQIYDYGEAGPGHPPFLVMELVDGPPLARLLADGPLDPARVLDIIAQAADGLAAAHAAGLVHRDVKPGNLLLAPGDRLKITDFGIAHAAGTAPITRTGMLIGTPAYLAPERVAGSPPGPAGDLYALGIVGYECLAGAPPFAGTAMEVALAHQMRALPPLPPGVPAGVAALVAQLTAKDPAARPAGAREVADRARRLRAEMLAARPGAGATAWGAADVGTAGTVAGAGAAAWAADARGDTAADPGVAGAGAWPGATDAGAAGAGAAAAGAAWEAADAGAADTITDPGAASVGLAGAGAAGVAGAAAAGAGAGAAAWPATDARTIAGGGSYPATLLDTGRADPPRRAGPGRAGWLAWPRRHRAAALAAVLAVLIVGLAAWMLAGASGGGPPRHPAAAQSSAPTSRSPAARLVTVSAGSLVGQPVPDVVRRLRGLGLQVRVRHVLTGQQQPGTVVSVQPGGQVPAGSVVTVTGALAPRSHGDGGGKGHGNDKGHGNGNGQGGD